MDVDDVLTELHKGIVVWLKHDVSSTPKDADMLAEVTGTFAFGKETKGKLSK